MKKSTFLLFFVFMFILLILTTDCFAYKSNKINLKKEIPTQTKLTTSIYGAVSSFEDKTQATDFWVKCINPDDPYNGEEIKFSQIEYSTVDGNLYYVCTFGNVVGTNHNVTVEIYNNSIYGDACKSKKYSIIVDEGEVKQLNISIDKCHISIYNPNSTHYDSEYTFYNPIYNITNTTPNFQVNYTLRDYTDEARISINNQPNQTLCTNCNNNTLETYNAQLTITQDTQDHNLTIYTYNGTDWIHRTTFFTTNITKPDYQITNLEIKPQFQRRLVRNDIMQIKTSYQNIGGSKSEATLNIYQDSTLLYTTTINPNLNQEETHITNQLIQFTPSEQYTSEDHNITAEITHPDDTNTSNNNQTKTKTFFDYCIKRIIRGRQRGLICFT